jgi:hypothetical protein
MERMVSSFGDLQQNMSSVSFGVPRTNDFKCSHDPSVPYTLLVGNTAIIPPAVTNGTLGRLLSKLAPQRVLHGVATLAFFN